MPSTAAAALAEWHSLVGEDRTPALRARLIKEEAAEVVEAIAERDRAHIAKELADLVYVAYGGARAWDIPLDAVLEEVHRSNLTKISGGVKYRADGKVLKGPAYEDANVESVLAVYDSCQLL